MSTRIKITRTPFRLRALSVWRYGHQPRRGREAPN